VAPAEAVHERGSEDAAGARRAASAGEAAALVRSAGVRSAGVRAGAGEAAALVRPAGVRSASARSGGRVSARRHLRGRAAEPRIPGAFAHHGVNVVVVVRERGGHRAGRLPGGRAHRRLRSPQRVRSHLRRRGVELEGRAEVRVAREAGVRERAVRRRGRRRRRAAAADVRAAGTRGRRRGAERRGRGAGARVAHRNGRGAGCVVRRRVVEHAPVHDLLERVLPHLRGRVVVVVVVGQRLLHAGGRRRGAPAEGRQARAGRARGLPCRGADRRAGPLRLGLEDGRAHHRAHLVVVVVVRGVLVLERRERAHAPVGVPLLERLAESGGAAGAAGRLALEGGVEDVLEVVVAHVEDGERRRARRGDALPQLEVVRTAEGRRGGEHLVERGGERPDVVGRRDVAARDALGRLVGEPGRRLADVDEDAPGGAVLRGRDHARRRDAAVRDAERVQRLDALRETDRPPDRVELFERAFARDSIGDRFHGAPESSTARVNFVPGSARGAGAARSGSVFRAARGARAARFLVELYMMGPSAHAHSRGRAPAAAVMPDRMRCRPRWLSVGTGRAGRAALAAGLLLASAGCRREVDLGRVYGPERAVTTVRYLGARGETRLSPGYGAIDACIRSPEHDAAPRGRSGGARLRGRGGRGGAGLPDRVRGALARAHRVSATGRALESGAGSVGTTRTRRTRRPATSMATRV